MVRRWVPALVLGGVWWWAVLRLLLEPEHVGLVEGAVAAGGWGLSLLPVHVAASAGPTGAAGADGDAAGWFAVGIRRAGSAWRTAGVWSATGARLTAEAWRTAGVWSTAGTRLAVEVWRTTRAWRRRRSGGGSGRS
ncbi:hypothetical protein ABZY10_36610 [Streptomyces sp. NPDC006539]|uniref:hypothetical protein n=1 Tax=Streptomyces sp. NPDC006539 TaxID=3155352 RepID=UPI0033B8D4F4